MTNDVKKELKRIYKRKDITDNKFNEIVSGLNKLMEKEPEFYYFNMGTFLTNFGNPNDAIYFLENALMYADSPAVYLNLFKNYVKVGEYEKAFENLRLCKQNDVRSGDFSLPLRMLCSLSDIECAYDEYKNTDYTISSTNKIYYTEFNDSVLANLYADVIHYFNSRDYIGLIDSLDMMKERIEKEQINFDIEPLILIANALEEKRSEKFAETLLEVDARDIDIDEYIMAVESVLNAKKLSPKYFFATAKSLINEDFEKATELIEVLDIFGSGIYDTELFSLKNMLVEKKKYNSLNADVRKNYDNLKVEATIAFKSKDYDLALEKFNAAYETSKLPIMYYYIGKTLFKQGDFVAARDYLLKYSENGGEKLDKCLLYLGVINKNLGKTKKATKYFSVMNKLNDSFGSDFKFHGTAVRQKKRSYKGEYDALKVNAYQNVVMDEDDFLDVDPENFYNCNVGQKLAIIRGFLREGRNDVADSLMRELGRLTKEEKAKVVQFRLDKRYFTKK